MFFAIEAITGVVTKVLDKFVPDAKDRLEAEQLVLKSLLTASDAQIEVNKVEAASTNLFVSGWRPFVGWVCGGSLAYAAVGYSFLQWLVDMTAVLTATPVPAIPKPDTTITLEILMGMLGMGAFRTYEKTQGVANK